MNREPHFIREKIKDERGNMRTNANQSHGTDNLLSDYMDRLSKTKGANRDADGLGVMSVGGLLVGGVDAISGKGGEEISGFIVTRHELRELAKYWFSERLEADFDWFLHQCTGSSEWRWSKYITRRLERLAETLGLEEMRNLWNTAIASFRKGNPMVTDEDWNIFRHGTEDEQEAWRARTFREDIGVEDGRSDESDDRTVSVEKRPCKS
jgi:hypothetical protein